MEKNIKNKDKKMNTYFKAIQEKINIFHDEKQGPEFRYVKLTHAEFNQNYCEEGWMGRKVMALPKAMWSGTIKTLYYLAQAIIARLVTKNPDDFQIKCFYTIRELEKSLGWFISLFHDRTGQFYVQESQFYQARYDCFLLNKEFEKIENLKNGKEKDERYQKLAQIFLSKGDLGRAFKAIHLIQDNQIKQSFINSYLKNYINTKVNKNKLDSDFQLIDDQEKQIVNEIISDFLIKLDDFNIKNPPLPFPLNPTDDFSTNSSQGDLNQSFIREQNPIAQEFNAGQMVNLFCESKQIHFSYPFSYISSDIDEFSDSFTPDNLLEFKGKLAIWFCQQKNLRTSLEIIEKLHSKEDFEKISKEQEFYLGYIAEAFMDIKSQSPSRKDIFDKIPQEIVHGKILKEFIIQIIDSYYSLTNDKLLEDVFIILTRTFLYIEDRCIIKLKLVQAFLKHQKVDLAYQAAEKIFAEKYKCFAYIEIAKFYWKNNNLEETQQYIKQLCHVSFQKKYEQDIRLKSRLFENRFSIERDHFFKIKSIYLLGKIEDNFNSINSEFTPESIPTLESLMNIINNYLYSESFFQEFNNIKENNDYGYNKNYYTYSKGTKTDQTNQSSYTSNSKLEQAWNIVEEAWEAKKEKILKKDQDAFQTSRQKQQKDGGKPEDSYVPLPEFNRKITKDNLGRIKRRLAHYYHPDRVGENIETQNKFKIINDAFDIIINHL
jgi:hypothetical protein